MIKVRRRLKIVATFMLFNFLNQIFFPVYSFALTSGPKSPEFSSFEPIATTNMVDPFTGDFTYNLPVLNIPGPEGGGYALSLSYHSGVTPEEEASWVGYGWTLSPGALNRNKQGYPDDYKGADVTEYNKIRPNWTASAVVEGSLEIKTKDSQSNSENDGGESSSSSSDSSATNSGSFNPNISFQKSIRMNNYKGFYSTYGFGVGVSGVGSLSMTTGKQGTTFGINVNPSAILRNLKSGYEDAKTEEQAKAENGDSEGKIAEDTKIRSWKGDFGQKMFEKMKSVAGGAMAMSSSDFGGFDIPMSLSNYYGISYTSSLSFQPSFFDNIGIQLGATASFNAQFNPVSRDMLAYGYMYTPDWTLMPSQIETYGEDGYYSKILTDYTVERDAPFSKQDKFLGIPFGNPDLFSTTGEKVMGGFRIHHKQMGQFYPTLSKSYMKMIPLGLEVALSAADVTIGLDVGVGYQWNYVSNWTDGSVVGIDEIIRPLTLTTESYDVDGLEYKLLDVGDVKNLPAFVYISNNINTKIQETIQPNSTEPVYIRIFDTEAELPKHLRDNKVVSLNGVKHLTVYNREICPSPIDDDGDLFSGKFNSTAFDNPDNPGMLYVLNTLKPLKFEDEAIFKFTLDPANEWTYTDANEYKKATVANLSPNLNLPIAMGAKKVLPNVTSLGIQSKAKREPLTSKIDYHTFGQLDTVTPFSNHSSVEKIRGKYSGDEYNDAIAEFEIIGDDGSRTVYGLPIVSKEEYSISIGVDEMTIDDKQYIAYAKSKLSLGDNILDNKQVTGTYSKTPYATSYLLTEINNTNYVDLKNDGPSDDDIGGWTRFDYREWNGKDWYNYRMPYKGLYFQRGEYSDVDDDVASLTRGKKKVVYLNGVETKTHYAFFVTNLTEISDFVDLPFYDSLSGRVAELLNGSGDLRNDGIQAPDLNSDGSDSAALEDYKPSKSEAGLEKLERIVLVSKKRLDQPLSVVNFEYDYSLCQGASNNVGEDEKNGKLTLTSVWFESDGVVRNKIAPYKFEYNYPKHNITDQNNNIEYYFTPDGDITEKYDSIVAFYEKARIENPPYDPFSLDPWGNYRCDGIELSRNHFKWVNQDPDPLFDPAAWNLKRIILPSGGEILVQYEQDEYAYVQDEKAATMKKISIDVDSYDDASYYVDYPKGLTADEKQNYITDLQEYFYSDKAPVNYIYFRFLYNIFQGNASLNHDLNECEYITGYTTVRQIKDDGGRIFIRLGDKETWDDDVTISERDGITFPREVCADYYYSNRYGKFRDRMKKDIDYVDDKVKKMLHDQGNDLPKNRIDDNRGVDNGVRDIAYDGMWKSFEHVFFEEIDEEDICKSLDVEHSYLRIPVCKTKKGGGVRVKRLLMYDKGLETGEDNLYGSEYHYVLEDGTSSGVATTEPGAAKEENPLVKLLDRANCSFIRKVFVGEERKQQEGPLGGTVMNSPSVGYSRVVVENIHKGATGTGYQVHNFHTCKDYPFFADATTFDKNTKQKDWLKLPLGLININIRKAWYSQGYAFVKNNMHGKSKSIATYAGTYSPERKDNFDAAVSYTKNEYFSEGERVKCLSSDNDNNNLSFETIDRLPGVEEDIAVYDKKIEDKMFDFTLEFDITLRWGQPFSVIPGFNLGLNYSYNEYGTHVMSKVWNMPAILKSTTSYAQGVTTTTENLAFDIYTGKPIVTRTYDGYHDMKLMSGLKHDGSYYTYKIPAYLIYDEMGPVTMNDKNTNQLQDVAGQFVTYGKQNDGKSWIELLNENAVNPYEIPPEGVVSASAVVYEKDIYTKNHDLSNELLTDLFEKEGLTDDEKATATEKLNKLYKPVATYSLKNDNMKSANSDDIGLVFQAGVIENSYFSFFNWDSDALKYGGSYKNHTGDWILGSEITAYSPGGIPLEERNVLDINSAVRLGYEGNFLPTIIAQNATYNSIFFNDYENADVEQRFGFAHSGKKAKKYVLNSQIDLITKDDNVILTEQLLSKGALLKMWIKATDVSDPNMALEDGELFLFINNSSDSVRLERIGGSGDWDLFHARIKNWDGVSKTPGQKLEISLNCDFESSEVLYIDDVCFHPYDAEVSCNVYDVATFKPLVQFNSQHFGVFYYYNDEGQLVYKSIETERGKKMLQEQQSHIVRTNR